MLDLILHEPTEDVEEKLRFKLPNIASEVITCDVAQVREHLSFILSFDFNFIFFRLTKSFHPTPPSLTSFMHFLSHRLPLTLC